MPDDGIYQLLHIRRKRKEGICRSTPNHCGIIPKEFFDMDSESPSKAKELFEIAKTLSSEQLDNLIGLAKGLKK